MTKFDKAQFTYFGGYLKYGPDNKFVARFKYRGPFNKAKFIKELIKNHTVESYFAEMDARKAPLTILKDANPDWYNEVIEKYYG